MTMKTLARAMALMQDAYPRADLPDRTIQTYAAKLQDLDPAEVYDAMQQIVRTSKWPPSLADIREAVAERTLNLPTVEEAWEIAESGSLKNAPEPVRRAAEYVGGRWNILHSDNPTATRAQFREAYEGYRATAIRDFQAGSVGRRALALDMPRELMAPTMASLPESEHAPAPPVHARWLRRIAGKRIEAPTEAEKSHAIEVLRWGPPEVGDPDPIYLEAERIFAEASS